MTASPASSTTPTASLVAYVGCYTTKQRNGHGEGVSVYRMDRASGRWTQVQLVRDIVNPSFLALDRQQRYLYAAHGDLEYATSFEIVAQTGQLKVLNQQSTGGKNGVHLAIDATNRFLRSGKLQLGNGRRPSHQRGRLTRALE